MDAAHTPPQVTPPAHQEVWWSMGFLYSLPRPTLSYTTFLIQLHVYESS